jgi:hypothetical protein
MQGSMQHEMLINMPKELMSRLAQYEKKLRATARPSTSGPAK